MMNSRRTPYDCLANAVRNVGESLQTNLAPGVVEENGTPRRTAVRSFMKKWYDLKAMISGCETRNKLQTRFTVLSSIFLL
jgi:hypothetical protein